MHENKRLPESKECSKILLIDDSKLNIWLIKEMLTQANYDVVFALDGKSGLDLAVELQPHLILLDVVMPELNGFDVCLQLKERPETQHIPIIFMTAESNIDSLLRAFEAGGVDLIKKPVNRREALARIQTHLTIQSLQKGLEHQIEEREKLINDLSAFTHMVAHDLKNPISTMLGFSELIINAVDQGNRNALENYVQLLQQAGHKSYQIIDSLLLLANVRLKEVTYTAVDTHLVVEEAISRLHPLLTAHQAKIVRPESWPFVLAYAPWFEEVWVNLLSNAIKYGGSPPIIVVGHTQISNTQVRFFVRDNGRGLTEEQQAQLFRPFVRFHTAESGHGVGLSNVARIIERLGGRISVESKIDIGTTFYFTLFTS